MKVLATDARVAAGWQGSFSLAQGLWFKRLLSSDVRDGLFTDVQGHSTMGPCWHLCYSMHRETGMIRGALLS